MDNFSTLKFYEDVDSWETLMFLYNAALKEINTKIEILNDEFQHVHHYTPIEHIKSRIKTPESIVKKLKKNGYEVNVQGPGRQIFSRAKRSDEGLCGDNLHPPPDDPPPLGLTAPAPRGKRRNYALVAQ